MYFQNRIGQKAPKYTAKERVSMGYIAAKQNRNRKIGCGFLVIKKESDHASYAGIIRFRLKGSEFHSISALPWSTTRNLHPC